MTICVNVPLPKNKGFTEYHSSLDQCREVLSRPFLTQYEARFRDLLKVDVSLQDNNPRIVEITFEFNEGTVRMQYFISKKKGRMKLIRAVVFLREKEFIAYAIITFHYRKVWAPVEEFD